MGGSVMRQTRGTMRYSKIAIAGAITVAFSLIYMRDYADVVAAWTGHIAAIFILPALVGGSLGGAVWAIPWANRSKMPPAWLVIVICSVAALVFPGWVILMMYRPH